MLQEDRRIPYPMKRDLALLFDLPIDFSMTSDGVKLLQDNVAARRVPPDQTVGVSQPAKKPVKGDASQNAMTPAQRRLGGQLR